MAAPGTFQRVHTNDGWHGRVVGANGEKVWWTESYADPRSVIQALDVFAATLHTTDVVNFSNHPYPPVEVVDVDERTLSQEPHGSNCPGYLHQHGRMCSSTCPTCGGSYV